MLEDPDYADIIGLLSSKQQDAQQKAEHLSKTTNTIGLKVNTKKTQVRRKNTSDKPVMIDGKHIEDVENSPIWAVVTLVPKEDNRRL